VPGRPPLLHRAQQHGESLSRKLARAGLRDEVITRLREDEHVIMLGCGATSLRLRPALSVTADELDRAVDALDRVLRTLGH